ncbi:MAG: SprB repeat-containing protein, partial [Bacteroidetes bacterium]|nr:SprB repeat-containing protein [Bacteroidota bacterium]
MKAFFKYYFIFCVFANTSLFCQNENSKWYFGVDAALDFITTPPTVLSNSSFSWSVWGCSSIADAFGNLLFYTNGQTVWNNQHIVMANGSGLLATVYGTALIVKQPGSNSVYYIFTVQGTPGGMGFHYSVVDMSLAAGAGSVTVKNAPIYLPHCASKLHAAKHANGIDYWIMTHEDNTNNFRAYLFTAGGINTVAVVSSAGMAYHSNYGISGQLKFSSSGQKIGTALMATGNFSSTVVAELYDFNNSTGVVSNPVSLQYNHQSNIYAAGGWGCEFSPDGSRFYQNQVNNNIIQWDVNAGLPLAIQSSSVSIANNLIYNYSTYSDMQLAIDGKIYTCGSLSPSVYSLSVINNPNAPGLACNYVNCGQLANTATTNINTRLPNMVPMCTFTLTTQSANAACNGANTGSASILSVSGNSGTPTYSWSNGITSYSTQSINNISAGSWTVTATDVLGCTSSSVFTITQPPAITVNISSSSPTACAGGSVTLNANTSGGVGTFSYLWQGITNTQTYS